MSYPRWICLTTALTLLFTTGGLWLEARLKGEPAASAKATVQTQNAQNAQTEIITATVQVLITGAVQKPGMYRLPAGSNLQTLLAQAGGSTPEARLSELDLNRPVRAGEVLHVPAARSQNTPESAPSAAEAPGSSTASTASTSSKASSPISLNRAGLKELEQLPGVGPSLAKRILEWRQAHGGFKKIDDLLEVKGIGPKKLDKMRPVLSL